MGRPTKASEQHWLDHSKPQSKASVESHVRPGRPKFPADLNDPKLRRLFKELCCLLEERRSLSKGDRDLLRIYCLVHDRHRRNIALLRQEGELVTYVRLDSNGQPHDQVKENLRLKICVTCEKQMASILSQLGLTPTAKDRARPTGGLAEEALPPDSVGALYGLGTKVTPINVPPQYKSNEEEQAADDEDNEPESE